MSSHVDVLVVGAGPAGATAARTLARDGARVALLDRAVFPRNKPCGGAITTRALRRFPHLCDALPRIDTHRICRLYIESPDGSAATITSPEPAVLMIRRIEFDALLTSLAVEAGVELVEHVDISQAAEHPDHVDLTARDGRRFRAPLVIAADGVNSVIARRLGINRGWRPTGVALDMMEEAPIADLRCDDPDTLSVYYGYGNSDGYGYIFPKAAHVNVGIGFLLSFFRENIDRAPYDLQQEFVDGLRQRGTLVGASRRQHFTPFLIPVGGPLERTGTPRVLVAGDAGGFVNASTAEGIYYAMVSGELAAAAILKSAPRSPLERYTRAWRREIGPELTDSVLLQRYLFADRRRVDRIVDGARHAPRLVDLVLRYATGAMPYRSARRRILFRFPLLGVRLTAIALRWQDRTPVPTSRLAARTDPGL